MNLSNTDKSRICTVFHRGKIPSPDVSVRGKMFGMELLKQRNPQVIAKAAEYLQFHGPFALSAFTRFEIGRGYKAKGAAILLTRFREFCSANVES